MYTVSRIVEMKKLFIFQAMWNSIHPVFHGVYSSLSKTRPWAWGENSLL